jgi:hypothetical protein
VCLHVFLFSRETMGCIANGTAMTIKSKGGVNKRADL